jgi:porin
VCLLSNRPAAASAIAAAFVVLAMTVGFAPSSAAQEQEGAVAGSPEPAGPSWSDHATGDWFGVRAELLLWGVAVDIALQADHSTNLAGGLRRGSVLRRPAALALSIETAPLLGWKGGLFHATFQIHEGRHGTEALVGDAQGFDNVDARRFRQLSELWFEQTLFRERLRLRIGKLDANSDFATVENGSEFLNSSAGFSPTIQGFPSYPDPATGVSAFVSPSQWLYAGAGVYDGATHEGCHGRTGNRGPATLWGDPRALFLIGEAGLQWKVRGQRAGRVGAGAWRHTGYFERFDGGRGDGAAGSYLVLEQDVWRESASAGGEQGLAAFAQLGWANGEVSEIDQHVGLGLAWSGAIPGRDLDVLGAMVSSVRFTDAPQAGCLRRRETALEVFYRIQLLPWVGVTSDLQYIAAPGVGGARPALVWTVRAQVAL